MTATSILINVGARVAPAVTGLDRVQKALRDQDAAIGTANTNMGKFSTLAKAGFAAAGAAAVAGIGTAVTALIDFGVAAYQDEQAAKVLDGTLKNLGFTSEQLDRNRAWIDSMELATLVSDTKLRTAIGRLTAQTGDYALAQQQTVLAADLATGANISFEKALKAVQSANEGAVGPLSKYVDLQDTNHDGTIDLTEATDALAKAYGGAAKAAADNDPWKRLKTLWDQLKESLGAYLLPLMEDLGDWFKDPQNQKKIEEFIEDVRELSYEFGEDLSNAIQDAYKWFKSEEGQQAIKDLKQLFKDTASIVRTVAGLFEDLNGFRWVLNTVPILGLARAWDAVKDAAQAAAQWLGIANGRRSGGGSFRSLSPALSSRSGVNTATINLYGSASAQDARVIKRALEGYDVSQGRGPGTPLAVAW